VTTPPLPFEGGETAFIAVEPIRRLATSLGPTAGPFRWLRAHLTDEWLVVLLAVILSITFYRWYATHGLTVAFNDARSREMIARRVLMSRTPGLAQLGSTWLPLPGLLMLPLIWNDTLFRDGLAGSFPSMAAYVIAGLFMYRSARLVTDSRPAGWVAAGVLLLNPNVLYMQSTPMSELPSLAAFVVSIYYALRLMRTYHALDVVKCAAAVTAGTLIRYENWVLGMALVPIFAFAALRRRGYELAEAWAILYSLLAFAGCAAWILYNTVIFHDPLLSFFYGQSDHKYYANTPGYLLPARHHAGAALKMYGLTVAGAAGWVITALAALGFVLFLWRNRLRLTAWPAYVTLLPFGFYWLVLYMGVNTESLPQMGTGPYYNVRFGLLMIPALALFSGYLMTAGQVVARRVLPGAVLAVILVVSVMNWMGGKSLVLREAVQGYGGDTRQTDQVDAQWLSTHYHGGNILYTYVNDPSLMFYLLTEYGFPDRAFITDANGAQFTRALAEPQRWVTWIVINNGLDNSQDPLWGALHRQSAWRRYFVLRKTFPWHHSTAGYNGTVQLFERRPATGPAAYHAVPPAGQARPRASVMPPASQARPRASVVLSPLLAHGVDETSTNAGLAIDNNLSTAWKTQWYLGDPAFGGLKRGAGLVLDMGHPVRLSSVQVTIGPVPGADVQIKVGNTDPLSAAAVSAMTTVARADDVGGTHTFAVRSRATGRYVLIWFTKLPPDAGASGRYQAEIFNVILRA
jgi:dolichyl-phosphate-mannose-protein mannosyltransferase